MARPAPPAGGADDEGGGMDAAALRPLLRFAQAQQRPLSAAFALGADGRAAVLLHRRKPPRQLERQLKGGEAGSRNHRFGTAEVDQDNPRLVRFTVNKAAAGMARRLVAALKGTGYRKVIIASEDGAPPDQAEGDEAEEAEGGAPGQAAQGRDGDTNGGPGAGGAPAPAADPTEAAARSGEAPPPATGSIPGPLRARLAALARRAAEARAAGSSGAGEFGAAAGRAQQALRAGDAEALEAAADELEGLLGGPPNGAGGPDARAAQGGAPQQDARDGMAPDGTGGTGQPVPPGGRRSDADAMLAGIAHARAVRANGGGGTEDPDLLPARGPAPLPPPGLGLLETPGFSQPPPGPIPPAPGLRPPGPGVGGTALRGALAAGGRAAARVAVGAAAVAGASEVAVAAVVVGVVLLAIWIARHGQVRRVSVRGHGEGSRGVAPISAEVDGGRHSALLYHGLPRDTPDLENQGSVLLRVGEDGMLSGASGRAVAHLGESEVVPLPGVDIPGLFHDATATPPRSQQPLADEAPDGRRDGSSWLDQDRPPPEVPAPPAQGAPPQTEPPPVLPDAGFEHDPRDPEEAELVASMHGRTGTEIQNAINELRARRRGAGAGVPPSGTGSVAPEPPPAPEPPEPPTPEPPVPSREAEQTPRDGLAGGRPAGEPEPIDPRSHRDKQEGLRLQAESEDALAAAGYRVERAPAVRLEERLTPAQEAELPRGEPDPQGRIGSDKHPDDRVGGNLADMVAPKSSNPEQVRKALEDKVKDRQAYRLTLNLGRTSVTREQVEALLRRKPVRGLQELLIIEKDGAVSRAFPDPQEITPGRPAR